VTSKSRRCSEPKILVSPSCNGSDGFLMVGSFRELRMLLRLLAICELVICKRRQASGCWSVAMR
jgi:hypothetical protein